MSPDCPREYGSLACWIFDTWKLVGWAGVDLFFVLSGFLVSGLLFREHQSRGQISFAGFFVRRGLKIYPAFYVLFIIYGLFEWRMGIELTPNRVAGELLYLQNYLGRIWIHTWTLAVEEHFYLFIGVVLAWLSRRGRVHDVVRVAWLVLGFCLVARVLTWQQGRDTVFATHLRMDSLMFGVLLSYVYHFHHATLEAWMARWWRWMLAGSLLLVAPLLRYDYDTDYYQTIGFTLNYLGFGGILLVSIYREGAISRRAGTLGGRFALAIAFVGVNSYSIYLWHMLVKRALSFLRKELAVEVPYMVELVLYVGLAVAVGAVMAWLVEKPVLKLRDRLIPSHSGELAALADTPPGQTATRPAADVVLGKAPAGSAGT
jgi:peptidoglycan/LPS O-acetylase OafA/YrhL